MPNEVKLLPCDCPFCGTAISKFMTRRNEPYWKHPLSGCVLSRFILVPDRIPDWNTRATDAARPTTVVTDEVVERPDVVKALWAIFMRIDTMPKSNRNMGLDMWTIKTLQLVRETIDLASMPTVVTGE